MNLRFCLLIILSVILQVFFLPVLLPGYPVFNLALCVSLVAAFLGYGREAVLAAFFFGILQDLFSFTDVGFSSLFLVFAVLTALEVRQFFGSNFFAASLICFLFSGLFRYFFGFFEISLWLFVGAVMDVFLFLFLRFVLAGPMERILVEKDRKVVF